MGIKGRWKRADSLRGKASHAHLTDKLRIVCTVYHVHGAVKYC
jgi:hypothetical protein